MSQATYSFHSGSEEVTSVLQEPVTDPDVARRIGRQISEMDNQRDATIIVRSQTIELGGQGAWRGIEAVFINGEEITPDNERYPDHVAP